MSIAHHWEVGQCYGGVWNMTAEPKGRENNCHGPCHRTSSVWGQSTGDRWWKIEVKSQVETYSLTGIKEGNGKAARDSLTPLETYRVQQQPTGSEENRGPALSQQWHNLLMMLEDSYLIYQDQKSEPPLWCFNCVQTVLISLLAEASEHTYLQPSATSSALSVTVELGTGWIPKHLSDLAFIKSLQEANSRAGEMPVSDNPRRFNGFSFEQQLESSSSLEKPLRIHIQSSDLLIWGQYKLLSCVMQVRMSKKRIVSHLLCVLFSWLV